MKINEIFKRVREYQGRKQHEIAHLAGITHQSLSGFESEISTLSKNTQKEIAGHLGLNPDYIDGGVVNPFKSDRLIKVLIKEGILFENFEPLYFVAQFSSRITLIGLIAPPEVMKKLYRKLGITWIFAITFADSLGNIFLLRGKRDLINFAVDWRNLRRKISKVSVESNCLFSISQYVADKDLFEKIRVWDPVSKKDIEPLFHNVDFKEVNKEWTEDEEKQLTSQRSLQLDTLSELDLIIIKSMRDEKVSHDEILKFIKSKKSSIS